MNHDESLHFSKHDVIVEVVDQLQRRLLPLTSQFFTLRKKTKIIKQQKTIV